jgi:nitric oxide dioxygenase
VTSALSVRQRREDLSVLDEDDLVLVRRSFDDLWPTSRRFATLFYDHLFEHAPETRLFFRGDLDRQRSRLLTMITAMVGSLDRPDVFESIVAGLTTRHADYGVQPEHYGPSKRH